MDRTNPETIMEVKSTFELMENGLLADRAWVLGTDESRVRGNLAPTLVSDISSAFPTGTFSVSK